MPKFNTKLNPVSIVAFILTCLGCVHSLVAISVNRWWSRNAGAYYGVWSMELCSSTGECESRSSTELQGGEEALVVSKIFTTITVFLSTLAVLLHIIYAIIRVALVRTIVIFLLGAAGLFGFLSVFVFLGFYNTLDENSLSLGAAFYVFVLASILCLVAAVVTAWAAVRKVRAFAVTAGYEEAANE